MKKILLININSLLSQFVFIIQIIRPQMPPKIYKKQGNLIPSAQPERQEEIEPVNYHHEQMFINPKSMLENGQTLERIRILVSLLSGILAGLLNLNQLLGALIYFIMHGLITVLIAFKVSDVSQFFMKKGDLFNGIGSGVLIFVCAWMIVYNIVYTL